MANKFSSKLKTLYICSNCGYQNSKWLGKCPSCDGWNTFTEEIIHPENKHKKRKTQTEVKTLNAINIQNKSRVQSYIAEFDRLVGGGLIPGSLILISGEPGIGKSTLLLQIANTYAKDNKVLYVSAEESEDQIKIRANRLKINNKDLYILTETNIYIINDTIEKLKPLITIIDSIQTVNNPDLDSISGSVLQIRTCTDILMDTAKKKNNIIFLVGHVTKEGVIAGPKILEHIVDVVLYMEGDKNLEFRVIKSNKNRFGSTFEIAVFEMSASGLVPVNNPSSYFIEKDKQQLPGSAIVTVMEGTRPILVEIQSLVAPSNMAYPRRIAEGVDYNKVLLISAILEKIIGAQLNTQEIYLKVVGGIKINEPSIDLGIAGAILSSYKNKPLKMRTTLIGEIGLTGEIRAISYIEQRLTEIEKLGFKKAYIPKSNLKNITKKFKTLELLPLEYINEIYNFFSNENNNKSKNKINKPFEEGINV